MMRESTRQAIAALPTWRKPLRQLGAQLRSDAPGAHGRWLTYALVGGAFISVRDTTDGFEFRIARLHEDGHCSLVRRAKWERELEVFVEHLRLVGWQRTADNDGPTPDGWRLATRFTPPVRDRRTA